MIRHHWLRGISSVLGVLFALPAVAAEYNFGVVPQHSAIRAAGHWQPFLNFVAADADVGLRFVTASDVPEFEERVLDGRYDFAYLNPTLFLQAQKAHGYRALARDERAVNGVIVVRADGGPRTLEKLRDRTIAFSSPRALSACTLPREELKRRGINHFVAYLSTHESVYRAVAQGRHVAGGGTSGTLEQLPANLRAQLRVLYTTQPVMGNVYAVHPRVTQTDSARVQETLLRAATLSGGTAQLAQFGERPVTVDARDFDRVPRAGQAEPVQRLAFHVIPRHQESVIRSHMEPLAAYLKQRLDLDVALHTYGDMGQFESAIYRENSPALINANPVQALRLARRGFRVVAQQIPRNSPEGMRGILLVRTDSPFKTVADLRGKRLAFGGNENAFFATVVPKAMLHRAGLKGAYIDVSRPGPVASVLPRLASGEVDAVGVGSLILNNQEMKQRYLDGRMRVLSQSEPMPGLAWLVGPNLDTDTREQIRHLLLVNAEAPGHAALQAAGIEGLAAADESTYTVVRRYEKGAR